MYTLDYIKSLHIALEVWNILRSRFGEEDPQHTLEELCTNEGYGS